MSRVCPHAPAAMSHESFLAASRRHWDAVRAALLRSLVSRANLGHAIHCITPRRRHASHDCPLPHPKVVSRASST
eukprot:2168403-Alexandrium_andersonii.AAC.1